MRAILRHVLGSPEAVDARGASRSRFLRRLPLLLVAAVGLLFILPRAPHDVAFTYHLGGYAAGLTEMQVEIRDDHGAPVRRTVYPHPAGATEERQRARLARGRYRIAITLSEGARTQRIERTVEVEDEDAIDLHL